MKESFMNDEQGLTNDSHVSESVDFVNENIEFKGEVFRKKSYSWMVWAMIVFMLMVGAGVYLIYGSKQIQEHGGLDKMNNVSVMLKWLHQTQFAGLYVADKEGLYEKNGIKANLIAYDYEHSPIDGVAEGKAQFGVVGADELLLARNSGKKLKALAVIYQESPVVAYVLADSGINKLEDMKGKVIGFEKSPDVEMLVRAMLREGGVDDMKDIKTVAIGYDANEIIEGLVDVATGYVVNEPKQVEARGYKVKTFSPAYYGVEMYADVLFTTDEMIEKNPELVQNFVDATLDGWSIALNDIDMAVNYTLSYMDGNFAGNSFEHQRDLLYESKKLINPIGSRYIGEMNYEKWQQSASVLESVGLIEEANAFNLEDAYTNKFIINRLSK